MVQKKFVVRYFCGKEASEAVENIPEEVVAHHLDFDAFRNGEELLV